jgi:glycosyltransferase involved in cell wall biosynthesis
MSTPFFSIIVPTYNRPDRLLKAVSSIYSQQFTDYEVIVVNDGSPADYTQAEQVIAGYGNVRYFRKENRGPSSARNFGIEKATGLFTCFLDDDDEYLPNHLGELHLLIEANNQQKGLYKTRTYLERAGTLSKQPFVPLPGQASAIEKVYANIFGTCNACVHSGVWAQCRFNTDIPLSEDYDLWSRIALRFPVFESEAYTTVYHFHGDNISLGDAEQNHLRHIRAFQMTFAVPGLKEKLPPKYWAGILSRRYLWLSEEQRKRKKIFSALASRLRSIRYASIAKKGQ